MADAILLVDRLMKSFGGLRATNDLSLEVLRGECHAIIGPNGAGKTTFISQLQGMLTLFPYTTLFRSRKSVV